MKGYFHMEARDGGVAVDVSMSGVSMRDKMHLLDSFLAGLKVDENMALALLMMLHEAKKEGAISSERIDMTELAKLVAECDDDD